MSVPVNQDVDNVPPNKVRPSGELNYVQLSDGVGNFRSNRFFTFDSSSTPKNLRVGVQGGGVSTEKVFIGTDTPTEIRFGGSGVFFADGSINIFDGELQMSSLDEVIVKPDANGNFGQIDVPLLEANPAPDLTFPIAQCEIDQTFNVFAGSNTVLGNGGNLTITSGKGFGSGNANGQIYLEGANTVIGLDDFGVDSARGDFKIITSACTYIMPKNVGSVNDRLRIKSIDGDIVTLHWAA